MPPAFEIDSKAGATVDNQGGTIAGLAGEGLSIENIFGTELDDDGNAIVITNHAGIVKDLEDNDVALGGGVIAGRWDGIDITDVWNGDIHIDNAGYWEPAGPADAQYNPLLSEQPLVFRSGGLIVGLGGEGIDIEEADGSVFIDNANTRAEEGGIDLSKLDAQVYDSLNDTGLLEDAIDEDGTIAGTGYTTGIWGGQHGISISEVGEPNGDRNGLVGINNANGLIAGVEGDGIRVRGVEGSEDFGLLGLLDLPVAFAHFNGDNGLTWGGDDGIDLANMDGSVIIENAGLFNPDATGLEDFIGTGVGGTIFGVDHGIRIRDVWHGDVLIANNGLIQGLYGDGIRIDEVDGFDDEGGNVFVINGLDLSFLASMEEDEFDDLDEGTPWFNPNSMIVAGDSAISIEDAETATIFNAGLIFGDGDWRQPVIDLELSDSAYGLLGQQAGTILNVGVMASRSLPGFVYSGDDWSPPEEVLKVRPSTFDLATLDADLASFQNYVMYGGSMSQLEGSLGGYALGDYRDAANDTLVRSRDGATLLINEGFMAGRLNMDGHNGDWSGDGPAGNVVVNAGVWFVTDRGPFAAAEIHGSQNDAIYNAGWIQTAFGDGDEFAGFVGVNEFYNGGGDGLFSSSGFGVLSMVDGEANDLVYIDGDFNGVEAEQFADGMRSYVAMDVDFYEEDADFLDIDDYVEGTTGLIIRKAGIGHGSLDSWGIDVARYDSGVENDCEGACREGDAFYISSLSDNYVKMGNVGVVEDGLLAWYLAQDENWDDFELRSTLGSGAINAPGIVTGAQNIFYDTLSVVDDHSYAHQFAGSGGGGADLITEAPIYDAPVATSPGTRSGLWAKASGSWVDRDTQVVVDGIGQVPTGGEQDIYSVLGGADMKWNADSPFRIGVFGGYVTSDLDFNLGGSSVDYEGGVVGVYGAYNNGAWYADLTVKGDFLSADYSFTGDEVDADVTNIGFAANAGYRFTLGGGFVEPVASLAYVHSDVDNFSSGGTSVSFSENDSLRAGAGARVGTTMAVGGGTAELSLLGKVWNEFQDANEVTVTSGGVTTTFSDDIEGVFGEVAATALMTSADGTLSGFVTAGGSFGEDFTAWTAKAGVRKGF